MRGGIHQSKEKDSSQPFFTSQPTHTHLLKGGKTNAKQGSLFFYEETKLELSKHILPLKGG